MNHISVLAVASYRENSYLWQVKKTLILILLYPVLLMAQTGAKVGTITIDLGKKKHLPKDTIAQPLPVRDDDGEDDSIIHTKKPRKAVSTKPKILSRATPYDFKKDGEFRGLIHAGANACQVDGDNEWGYKYFGAEFGIGALARIYRFLSLSLEMNYSMRGAKSRIQSTPDNPNYYQVRWNYLEAPLALNYHYRDICMVSAGLIPAYRLTYREFNYDGIEVTSHPALGQPNRLALSAMVGLTYIIRKHYCISGEYSYSVAKIRASEVNSRVPGEFNNDFTLRFVYILGPFRKK